MHRLIASDQDEGNPRLFFAQNSQEDGVIYDARELF